jgi:hypothetical protein
MNNERSNYYNNTDDSDGGEIPRHPKGKKVVQYETDDDDDDSSDSSVDTETPPRYRNGNKKKNTQKEQFSAQNSSSIDGDFIAWLKNVSILLLFIFIVTFILVSPHAKKLLDMILKPGNKDIDKDDMDLDDDNKKITIYTATEQLILSGTLAGSTFVFLLLMKYFIKHPLQTH